MKRKVVTAEKNTEELRTEVKELQVKLRELAFKAAGSQEKPHERQMLRRNIARLLTALRAKEGVMVDKQ